MEALGLAASIIGVIQITLSITETCYKYKTCLKTASQQISLIIQQTNSLRSVLENLVEIVEKEAPGSTRLKTLGSLAKGENGMMESFGRSLKELQEKLRPRSGWKAVGSSLTWPLREEEVRKVLSDLNDMKGTLNFALDVDHTTLALEMHSGIENLTQAVDAIQIDEHRREIATWLAAPDPFPNHNAARKKRQPSTGMWLLDSKAFTRWIRDDNSFLWLYGIPGCGKSVLCSTAIERLYSNSRQNPSISIAYFYFDFQNSGNGTVEALVCSLILQLFSQSLEIPLEIKHLRKQFKQSNNKPPLSNLLELLSILVKRSENTYFVIDALDECESQEELINCLEEFRNWNFPMLHILTFSRQLHDIEEFMKTAQVDSHCMDESSISDDINSYIKQQLGSDKRFSRWPEDIRLEIYNVLSEGAHGMFRWVGCQLDELRTSLSLKSLRKDLKSLPKSLEETYDRTLLRIPEKFRPFALQILAFLSFAGRPVSVFEVAELLAIDLEAEPSYDYESRLEPQDVLQMCSNLVTASNFLSPYGRSRKIINYSMYYKIGDGAKELRLAHLSVKDYLLSTQIRKSPASRFSIESRLANETIARSCLAYLLSPEFEAGPSDSHSTFLERVQDWPLLHYAVQFWPHHVIASQPLSSELWSHITKFFSTRALPNGGNYAAWIAVLSRNSSKAFKSEPLYYAASFGMTEVVQRLLKEDPNIDLEARGGRAHSSALHVAVYRGQNKVAKLLLEAGANVNDCNSYNESVLFWAVRTVRTDQELRTLLLDRGAVFTPEEIKLYNLREDDNAHLVRSKLQRKKMYLQ